MRYVNRAVLAQEAPDRWAEQHRRYADDEKMWKTAALLALTPEERMPARIAEIIGNDSWTRVVCDQCKEDVEEAIQFETDGNSMRLCLFCLEAALKLKPA